MKDQESPEELRRKADYLMSRRDGTARTAFEHRQMTCDARLLRQKADEIERLNANKPEGE